MSFNLSKGFVKREQGNQIALPGLLVVDDEPSITESIAEQFRHRYKVITVASGAEALDKLEKIDVGVIISDQRMPNMDGATLLARVALLKPDISRVMLTGYADIKAVVEAVNNGKIFFYLSKPWQSGELEVVIEKAFEHYNLLCERRKMIIELSKANAELEEKVRLRTQELEKKNLKLEELNNQKNQFIGIAAHDLRNPLSVILAYSQFLADDEFEITKEEHDEFISKITSTSEFMLELMNDLLDIAQIETGKLRLNLCKVDLISLIEQNVALNRILAERKQIKIVLSFEQNFPELLLDSLKIEQVLNNLISNAIKYSYLSSTITIIVSKNDNEIVIAVKDEGQGIPEKELEKLFRPFEKTSVQSTAGEKTTGLGLAIAKNIVIGHHGKIWVESKIGIGTTFFVSLPLIADCVLK